MRNDDFPMATYIYHPIAMFRKGFVSAYSVALWLYADWETDLCLDRNVMYDFIEILFERF